MATKSQKVRIKIRLDDLSVETVSGELVELKSAPEHQFVLHACPNHLFSRLYNISELESGICVYSYGSKDDIVGLADSLLKRVTGNRPFSNYILSAYKKHNIQPLNKRR